MLMPFAAFAPKERINKNENGRQQRRACPFMNKGTAARL